MTLTLRRGSSYEQAEAEICRVEVGEVAVALGPPAGVEVVAEASYRPLLGLRPHPRPHRHRTAHVILQIRLRSAPVRLEQAVSTVPWNRHRLSAGADRVGHPRKRGKFCEDGGELGQVVAGKPEPVLPSG